MSTTVPFSADSGPEKPENPNFENETRQTRTRTFIKKSNPTKPEPEVQTCGYPKCTKLLKNDKICPKMTKICPKMTNYQSNIVDNEITF